MTADELLTYCRQMGDGWWTAAEFRLRTGVEARKLGAGNAGGSLLVTHRLLRRSHRDADGRQTVLYEYKVA